MANPANVPWMASDTKRVTVMSVEYISSVIRTKRRGAGGGGGKRGDNEWSGRGLKGSLFLSHVRSFLYKYIKIKSSRRNVP